MRNLEVYGRQCIENLNAIGIYPHEIYSFVVNTRAKRRWGQAQKRNNRYSISINALLLNENCPYYKPYMTDAEIEAENKMIEKMENNA